LKGFVRVGEELVAGTVTKIGNLTIEAGTTIIGDIATKGTLVVHRGSKLNRSRNSLCPNRIYVWPDRWELGNPGDWGGVVLVW
jgi:hypothetical protein